MDKKNETDFEMIKRILEELALIKEANRKGTEDLLLSLLSPKNEMPCASIGEDSEKHILGVKDGNNALYFHMMKKTDDFIIRLVDLPSGKEKITTTSKKDFVEKHLNQKLLEAPYLTYKTPFGDLVRFNSTDVALYIAFLKLNGGVK